MEILPAEGLVPARSDPTDLGMGGRRPSVPDPDHSKSRRSSWLDDRFCLYLHQDTAGARWLHTTSSLDLPATHSEISLWLDLESLRHQISGYESPIIG